MATEKCDHLRMFQHVPLFGGPSSWPTAAPPCDQLISRSRSWKTESWMVNPLFVNEDIPQGSVLPPSSLSLYHNCSLNFPFLKGPEFVDETTMICLISNNTKSSYQWEVACFMAWWMHNYLQLSMYKSELPSHLPEINSATVGVIDLLGSIISNILQ